MIIKNFFKLINISKYTYIILLFALLTGLIKDLVSIIILIIFHEFGHYFVSYIFKYNIDCINIYPFGGLIKYNEIIDKPLIEELLITLAGPVNQIIIYLLFFLLYKYHYISTYFFNILKNYHYSILIFNLLPIIPLDGSKILNIILNKLFNFRLSYNLLIIISIFLSIILVFKYNNLIILTFIIYEIILSIKNKNIIFNRFILEKYLYKNNYKKYKYISNIKKLKRNKKHLIKYNNIYLSEKTYINNIYKDNMDKA